MSPRRPPRQWLPEISVPTVSVQLERPVRQAHVLPGNVPAVNVRPTVPTANARREVVSVLLALNGDLFSTDVEAELVAAAAADN